MSGISIQINIGVKCKQQLFTRFLFPRRCAWITANPGAPRRNILSPPWITLLDEKEKIDDFEVFYFVQQNFFSLYEALFITQVTPSRAVLGKFFLGRPFFYLYCDKHSEFFELCFRTFQAPYHRIGHLSKNQNYKSYLKNIHDEL